MKLPTNTPPTAPIKIKHQIVANTVVVLENGDVIVGQEEKIRRAEHMRSIQLLRPSYSPTEEVRRRISATLKARNAALRALTERGDAT
jgi:hypothetical protein